MARQRRSLQESSSVPAGTPDFEIKNEPKEGDLVNPAADFQLLPDGEGPEASDAPPIEVRTSGRKRGRPAGGKRGRSAAAPAPPADPAPELVATCSLGLEAITKAAETGLGFTSPSEQWNAVMAKLSARWIEQLEGEWMKTHTLEAMIILHLGTWIVPNSFALAMRMMAKAKVKNEQRSDAYFRPQTDGKDPLDAQASGIQ